jgi:hypothetical protein
MEIGANPREPLPLVATLNFNLMQPIGPSKKKGFFRTKQGKNQWKSERTQGNRCLWSPS